MHKIFELLHKYDLNSSNDFLKILTWKDLKINELINEIEELDINEKENSQSLFSFSANRGLSSGKNPCIHLDCRLKNISKLAQFAVLYSDNIFIYNPFEDYFYNEDWDDDAKQRLLDDLIILDYLRPLINKGILKFSKSQQFICKKCCSKLLKNFEALLNTIEKTIIDTTTFHVLKQYDEYLIETSSNPEYWGHAETYSILKNPNKFKKYLLEEDKHLLKTTDIKKLKLASSHAEEIMLDLIQQNSNVKAFNNNYLFTNNYYPQIVNQINNYKPKGISPYDIATGLEHAIPSLENTSLNNLISLRENDFESFLVYRDSIKRLISQTIDNDDFSNLPMAINDIVRPEINKMNLTVKNNKKMLSYKTGKELFINAGILTLGLFSGILPPDFGKIIGAVGGCQFVQAILSQVIDIGNPQHTIADNDFYFIWKMQQKN